MSEETSDERLGEEEEEPTRPGIAQPSPLALALSNLSLSLNEIVRDVAESARLVDQLETAERNHRIRDLATKMGELGDIAHDTRRALDALT